MMLPYFCVQGGAERMELHKPVYQRLNLGLITFSVALMGVMGGNIELLRPWALLIGTAECSAAATIPAWFYAATSGHCLQPITVIKALSLPPIFASEVSSAGSVVAGHVSGRKHQEEQILPALSQCPEK